MRHDVLCSTKRDVHALCTLCANADMVVLLLTTAAHEQRSRELTDIAKKQIFFAFTLQITIKITIEWVGSVVCDIVQRLDLRDD
eukprot:CAMPEP_0184380822 /NCGR_PEP_ID=MMETSP0007-20130409/5078_1 /TAXON_ID=97485 /ORGANISM="Prymnesium parvum, Strain Texoma1" /LENGTH=83 /DNA_ID=CAMNT_0026726221 /DNA_START=278 /DNA_END=529 /DNA_ORIENTATION=+